MGKIQVKRGIKEDVLGTVGNLLRCRIHPNRTTLKNGHALKKIPHERKRHYVLLLSLECLKPNHAHIIHRFPALLLFNLGFTNCCCFFCEKYSGKFIASSSFNHPFPLTTYKTFLRIYSYIQFLIYDTPSFSFCTKNFSWGHGRVFRSGKTWEIWAKNRPKDPEMQNRKDTIFISAPPFYGVQ